MFFQAFQLLRLLTCTRVIRYSDNLRSRRFGVGCFSEGNSREAKIFDKTGRAKAGPWSDEKARGGGNERRKNGF